jgi:hypothetical protein
MRNLKLHLLLGNDIVLLPVDAVYSQCAVGNSST